MTNQDATPVRVVEVSVFAVLGLLWRWRVVLVAVPLLLGGAMAGRAVADREWQARARFAPAAVDGGVGRASGLAAQFGFSLGGQSAESPDFYADLVRSHDVLARVVASPFSLGGGGEEVPLLHLFGAGGASAADSLRRGIDALERRLSVSVGVRSGVVTVHVRAGDPGLAAGIADRLVEVVSQFNHERRRSQAGAERAFVEARLREARTDLANAERALARFVDANRGWQDAPQRRLEVERLQREVSHAQQVHSTLAQAFERARMDEVRNTPLINVLESGQSSVRRVGSVKVAGLVGAFLGLSLVLALVFMRVVVGMILEAQRAVEPARVDAFMRRMPRVLRAMVPSLVLFLSAASLNAQGAALLPSGHWSLPVLEHLAARGIVAEGAAMIRFEDALLALRRGGEVEGALGTRSREAYVALAEEVAASVQAGAGLEGEVGRRVGPGRHGPPPSYRWHGATAESFSVATAADLYLYADRGRWAGGVEAYWPAGAAYWASHRAGPVLFWAGNRPVVGAPIAQGVVVGPVAAGTAVPAAGVQSITPLVILGARVDAALALARLPWDSEVRRPFLGIARLEIDLGRGIRLGGTRGAIFGGEGNQEEPSLLALLLLPFGATDWDGKGTGFENQVASADLSLAGRVFGVPASALLEWGFEDLSGAYFRVPGIASSVSIVPGEGVHAYSLRAARFWPAAGGNPPWYRHKHLPLGWSDGERMLGHPLGGEGYEIGVGTSSLLAGGTSVQAWAMHRQRTGDNVYGPALLGRALDLGAALRWPAGPVEVQATGGVEAGERKVFPRLRVRVEVSI
jgi:hypothetical protein